MLKMSFDKQGSVIVNYYGMNATVTAYSPKLDAFIVNFGYCSTSDFSIIILNIFKQSPKIVEMITSSKFNKNVGNVCCKINGKKMLFTSKMSALEIFEKIAEAEQD